MDEHGGLVFFSLLNKKKKKGKIADVCAPATWWVGVPFILFVFPSTLVSKEEVNHSVVVVGEAYRW